MGGFDLGLCDLDGAGSTDVGRDDSPGIDVLSFRDFGLFVEFFDEAFLSLFFVEEGFDDDIGDCRQQVDLHHQEQDEHDDVDEDRRREC